MRTKESIVLHRCTLRDRGDCERSILRFGRKKLEGKGKAEKYLPGETEMDSNSMIMCLGVSYPGWRIVRESQLYGSSVLLTMSLVSWVKEDALISVSKTEFVVLVLVIVACEVSALCMRLPLQPES